MAGIPGFLDSLPPLLVVGRDGDGGLLGLLLSSQHDRDRVSVGSGGRDREDRESFVSAD